MTAPDECPVCGNSGWYYPGCDMDDIPCPAPGCKSSALRADTPTTEETRR